MDHRFASLAPEAEVLARVPAEVVDLKGLDEAAAIAGARDCEAILLGARLHLDAERLDGLPNCRLIVRYGVGVDNVDLEAASERGIVVSCVPDYCTEEVATHAIALLLSLHRQLDTYRERARAGILGVDSERPISRLSTLALGIVGFGRIGRETARRAAGLGMRILAYDPVMSEETLSSTGAEPRTLDALVAEADAISLHAPLNSLTRNLLDRDRIARTKRGVLVINVGRGGLIDEVALAEALTAGHVGGAALDVTATEPLPPGHPLLRAPRTILTPHVAWYSTGAQADLQVMAAEEVARVLRGEAPLNRVNGFERG